MNAMSYEQLTIAVVIVVLACGFIARCGSPLPSTAFSRPSAASGVSGVVAALLVQ